MVIRNCYAIKVFENPQQKKISNKVFNMKAIMLIHAVALKFLGF